MSKGQVDLVDMQVNDATIANNDETIMCIHRFYLKSNFLCIQMKKKLPIIRIILYVFLDLFLNPNCEGGLILPPLTFWIVASKHM